MSFCRMSFCMTNFCGAWTMKRSMAAVRLLVSVVLFSMISTGCGYHTAGNAAALPQDVHSIAIPGFVSHSQTFRIEQLLTDAVVREFNARTQYHVIHDACEPSHLTAFYNLDVLSLTGALRERKRVMQPTGTKSRLLGQSVDNFSCSSRFRN